MRNIIRPVAVAVFVCLLFIWPRAAQAWIMQPYPLPTDDMTACDKRVQIALARVKGSTPGPLHFHCFGGLVQQLWFPEKSGIAENWKKFVFQNRDLFAPDDAKLKYSKLEGGVVRYWRGLKIFDRRIELVSASHGFPRFPGHAKMGLTAGILSEFPDTRNLAFGTVPKVDVIAAKNSAQQIWDEVFPGCVWVIKRAELGLYGSQKGMVARPKDGGSHDIHLEWVIGGIGTMKDGKHIEIRCAVNADTGTPEKYDCMKGYSL